MLLDAQYHSKMRALFSSCTPSCETEHISKFWTFVLLAARLRRTKAKRRVLFSCMLTNAVTTLDKVCRARKPCNYSKRWLFGQAFHMVFTSRHARAEEVSLASTRNLYESGTDGTLQIANLLAGREDSKSLRLAFRLSKPRIVSYPVSLNIGSARSAWLDRKSAHQWCRDTKKGP
jgi:hypothetical protein